MLGYGTLLLALVNLLNETLYVLVNLLNDTLLNYLLLIIIQMLFLW